MGLPRQKTNHPATGLAVRRQLAVSFVAALLFVVICCGQTKAQDVIEAIAAATLPKQLAQNEKYASSTACRECHPAEHDSWHRTYHRTMTQVASPENFVGKFDGTVINSRGLRYQVFMRNGEFRARMPDPDEMLDRQRTYEMKKQRGLATEPPAWNGILNVDRRVVMSTGSHHYQTYWVESKTYPGTLMTLPLVYLIKDERWIPREAAFMMPPREHRMVTVWNDHCISCHSTGPIPKPYAKTDALKTRVLETGFHSEVGEIGIACEACHGPAKEHVRLQNLAGDSTISKPGTESAGLKDPIVHPEKVADHKRSSQICGQCHGVFVRHEESGLRYRDEGIDYIPGKDLLATRYYMFPPQDADFYPDERSRNQAIADYRRNPDFFHERFWENGHVLAGGREFTGMAMSACYTKGTISCLSCHSMHDSDPNDQLKPGMETNQACNQCHDDARFTTAITDHTHHKVGSSGSDCMNCHMPHTTYALFSAIRSHQIASPDLAGSVQHGVPNGCNLCHLDKSLDWTQQHLAEWYDYQALELSPEQENISAALVWMLQGNAAQRVIVAWHVGWKPAQDVSRNDWLAPFVARLLADPYGVVRYVAEHSLATLPGFEDYRYDFLAPQDELEQAAKQAADQWQAQQKTPPSRTGREVLISSSGKVGEQIVDWLLQRRDNRPVTIKE